MFTLSGLDIPILARIEQYVKIIMVRSGTFYLTGYGKDVIIGHMQGTRRHRQLPFKVMCLLLYGDCDFITWDGTRVEVINGPLARTLRVPNSRLREYLEYLQVWDYIEELDFSYGRSTFRVCPPNGPVSEEWSE